MGTAPGVPAALPRRGAAEMERDYQIFGTVIGSDEGFLTEPTERCGSTRLQLRLGREEKSISLTLTLQATRARCAM